MSVVILSAVYGTKARLAVEVAWGADLTADPATWVWTDITGDVQYNNGQTVVITIGRPNEWSSAPPGTCTFQVRNPAGAYTANNPLSSNWPNVKRNTPVRVRATVDGGINWWLRFFGFANGFVPSWDEARAVPIVTVSASGITRRLSQGTTPLRSALYRSVITTSPVAYWPMEDGSSSTVAATAVSGGYPMSVGAKTPSFGSATGPAGSANVVDLSNGGTLQGRVASSSATSWRIEASVLVPKLAAATFATVFAWNTTGGISYWELTHDDDGSGGLFAQYTAADGSFAATFSSPQKNLDDGNWHHIRVDGTQSGGSTNLKVYVDTVQCLNWTVALTFGPVVKVIVNPTGDTTEGVPAIGHIAVWAPWSSSVDTYSAFTGYAGEAPNTRLARLCAEEGVPFATTGFYEARASMGPQTVDTLINLLRQCEITDAGFLYDGLSAGMTYQGISQRYDQSTALTLDAAGKDLKYPFTPVDDDQRNRNLVKATRKNGSSAVFEDVDGPLGTDAIGTYDSEVTVNTQDDSGLYNRAAWEVYAGTIEGFRYPSVSLSMLTNPSLLTRWLNRSNGTGPVLPGHHIDVANVSNVLTQLPPGTVALVLEGYQETISDEDWRVAGNCSQNEVYDVFKVQDARLGRLQAAASTLASGASAGASSLSVATTAGNPLWTTTATFPADFPFDVAIDGIQVTVTAITGTSSPQTFTVTGATVTKALGSGKSVTLWKPGVIKL